MALVEVSSGIACRIGATLSMTVGAGEGEGAREVSTEDIASRWGVGWVLE